MAEDTITAALLVIGDEILSGRTKDKNIGYIAEYLTGLGIDLREVRVVPDVEEEIVGAVNALRSRYTYLFTTGGIGPTHDDITADSVAKAFGVPIDVDPRAVEMLLKRISRDDLNEARLRMARIPEGADLVENPISSAPGFKIGNVIVMAGVPSIMQAMLGGIAHRLVGGAVVRTRTVTCTVPEGTLAAGLTAIQERRPEIEIGSYPTYRQGRFATSLVLRGTDVGLLETATAEVAELVEGLGGTPEITAD